MKNIIKQKFKNKFILILTIIIISILGYETYKTFSISDNDTNTYVVLIKGKVKINDYLLKKEERKKLNIGDKIVTKENSASVIEWGDGSLTRLGENGKIIIQELNVKKDLSQINLKFKLVNGKSWSNVVSFLGEKSYFKQNFQDEKEQDIEAAVRGTIFDVNLTKDYIYVANHEVLIQKGNDKKMIKQNQAFSISSFSFIEIQKFLNEIKDKTWESFNKNYDEKYFQNLKKDISKNLNIEEINKLISKNSNYNKILKQYQKLNFIKADDGELFDIKNKLKEKLIQFSSDKDKQTLVKYSIYDLKDAINSKNLNSIKSSFSILSQNKDIVKELNIDFNKEIFNNIGAYSKNIKDYFINQTNNLKDILGENFNKLDFGNINLDDITNKANSLRDEAINSINNLLNK